MMRMPSRVIFVKDSSTLFDVGTTPSRSQAREAHGSRLSPILATGRALEKLRTYEDKKQDLVRDGLSFPSWSYGNKGAKSSRKRQGFLRLDRVSPNQPIVVR